MNDDQNSADELFSHCQYGRSYYEGCLGPEPYDRRNPIWIEFFDNVARAIQSELHPKTFLDAGCAIGFLVESLRKIGVDARGFDISSFAIESVPEELAPFVKVDSITNEIDGTYDVISCIEVLEHLPAELAEVAIGNLCRHSDVVLFSSTPDDFDEPTHLNVRDGDYWASLFAAQGFFRDFNDQVAKKVSPQAVLFRRKELTVHDAIEGYESLLTRNAIEFSTQLRSSKKSSDLIEANLELAIALEQVQRLDRFRRWTEEYQATRLFRHTARPREFYKKLRRHLGAPGKPKDAPTAEEYQQWVASFEPLIQGFVNDSAWALDERPLVSIVMPTYNTPVEFLEAAIASVERQSYQRWELCIADDHSTNPETLAYLRTLEVRDPRIKVAFRSTNGHIAAASNTALAMATGKWVALLDHDDTLPPHAVAGMVLAAAEHPDANLIYSDRDMFDAEIGRYQPYFKPDFDPELILALNYVCHFQMMPRALLEELGGFREELAGSQDWDLTLRVIARSTSTQIIHVPLVLYHWRHHPGSVSASLDVKPYAASAAEVAVSDYLSSQSMEGVPKPIAAGGWFQIEWQRNGLISPVALAIVGKDTGSLGHAKRRLADLPASEIIEVLLEDQGVANVSSALNDALQGTSSEFICILDADLQPVSQDWLATLTGICAQPDNGVVGPSILSSNGKHLHTGIILGLEEGFGELYQGAPEDWSGAYGRLLVTRNFSAVSRSCMVIKREAWEAVGGFNDIDTPNYGNNVDLCLRMRDHGYRTLWTPHATLKTNKRYSPPVLRDPSWEASLTYLRATWAEAMDLDPYFNANLALTAGNDGFMPAIPPRVIDLFRKGQITPS